jgi:hypothetical protein
MNEFGKLKRLHPRDMWSNEARDFTPWVAEHIGELGEALGMELELTREEAAVGDFSLDILAKEVGRNRPVVIENQLTATDHDHLGKLLTYASGFDARVVIWIAYSIREEHRQALEWLNERTDSDTEFYGVLVEVLQIDDSKPAYNFRAIVFPNEWKKSIQNPLPGQTSEKNEKYREYFQRLIDELREKHRFTNARKGQPQSWYSFASGISGITLGMCFAWNNKARIEVGIDVGEQERNKELFDTLYSKKDQIESEYGESMIWERLDDRKSSRIALYREGSIEGDTESLEDLMKWSITHLIKMKKTVIPRIKQAI